VNGATIHSFEPAPATFQALRSNVASISNRVLLNETGLSDVEGEVDIYFDSGKSTVAGMYSGGDDNSTERIRCRFTTGDHYCQERNIEAIDFLKIDTEGADHQVLAGFGEMLRSRSVRCVQFEFGHWALVSRFLLADFYRSLEGDGYIVGRLYPDGVEFGGYELRREDFRLANYVAVLESDTELRSLLSCTPQVPRLP
jgi:FkbM family methyltransferase